MKRLGGFGMMPRGTTEGMAMLMGIEPQREPGAACVAATSRGALAGTDWLSSVPAATLDLLAKRAALHGMPPGSRLFEQADWTRSSIATSP